MKKEGQKYQEEDSTENAMEMLGAGYEHPSLELHPPQTVIRRRGWEMQEEVIPAFVKISTAFKKELPSISGNAMKIWLFIALSINRNTEQAHPGIRKIATSCSVSQNTVTSCIKELEGLGLLSVNREDRKYNIYEMPDYVSANSKTASKNDTDTKTASIPVKTASKKQQTASTSRGLTREPDKPDNTPANSKIINYSLLQKVSEDFKLGMKMLQAPWETNKKGWQSFPRWLLEQEEAGRPVSQFCEWFMSDPFRAKTITNYSPDGRKSDGLYSYKAIYLQAFETQDNDKPDRASQLTRLQR